MSAKSIPLLCAAIAIALLTCPSAALSQEAVTADCIDLEKLQNSGDDWDTQQEQLGAGSGRIVLKHDQWLMYFLHWRPLSEISDELSARYVEHRLLNFWGDSMPFELTGNGGPTEVRGHQAYFADGSIYNNAIKTRFIIWNCEHSGRQFTADCNINLSLGTNPDYLEIQDQMTRTICCHNGCDQPPVEGLEGRYVTEDWNLSFLRPSNWATSEYKDKNWFPDGAASTNGTLWTLLTDSEKRIDLSWRESGEVPSPELMRTMLRELAVDTTTVSNTLAIGGYRLDTTYFAGDLLVARGTLWLHDSRGDQAFTDRHSLMATLWTEGGRTFLLLASMIQNSSIWGRSVDLTPTDATVESFVKDVVYPATPVLPSAHGLPEYH